MESRIINAVQIHAYDVERTAMFYQGLFGWHFQPNEQLPQLWLADTGNIAVALAPVHDLHKAGDVDLGVESPDIDADLERVAEFKGKVVLPKTETPFGMTIAIIAEPGGAKLLLGQRDRQSLAVTNNGEAAPNQRPLLGAYLRSNDPEVTTAFCQTLFGWDLQPDPHLPAIHRAQIGPIQIGITGTHPPHKGGDIDLGMASNELDGDLARSVELGGQVLGSKFRTPDERTMGVVADPAGTKIMIIEM